MSGRAAEFAAYAHARLGSLRRIAYLLCQDWDNADDLVQSAMIRLYLHWGRASASDRLDSYARPVLVREFLAFRRSAWSRRVVVTSTVSEQSGDTGDQEMVLDLRHALVRPPPRQRATLVLRFYCDLSVDQTAHELGCSTGTVKSQTAKGLHTLRRLLEPGEDRRAGTGLARREEGPERG